MDDTIRKRIREMGPVMGPEIVSGSMALFAPLALRPAPDICSVERDIFYGPDQRHRLDLFRPAAESGARPIVVYVHGVVVVPGKSPMRGRRVWVGKVPAGVRATRVPGAHVVTKGGFVLTGQTVFAA